MLYGLLIDATAARGNDYPRGSRQHLLVLVRAHSEAAAMDEAMMATADKHWSDAVLKQIQPFGVAPSSIADPKVREAALRAEEGHRSIIVFNEA